MQATKAVYDKRACRMRQGKDGFKHWIAFELKKITLSYNIGWDEGIRYE